MRPAGDDQEFRASTGGVRVLAAMVIVAAVCSVLVALSLLRGVALVIALIAIVACTTVLVRLLKLAFAAPIVSLDDIGILVRGLGYVPWRDLDRVIVRPAPRGRAWVGLVMSDTTSFDNSRRAAVAALPPLARWIASASKGSHRLNRRLYGADLLIPVGAGSAPVMAGAIEARRLGGRPTR